jgi:uncharacterized RDD family membrane protein YckC
MTGSLTPAAPPAAVNGTGSAYGGLVTRIVAFALDAAIIDAVAVVVGVVCALALSLFNLPSDVQKLAVAAGGVAAVIWSVSYFTFFWSTTGQTPGNRVMSIEVRGVQGERLSVRRAFVRVLLLPLSVIPLGAGLWLILVDQRRRALHDQIARTVVVYVAKAPRERPPLRPRGAKPGGLPPSGGARERRHVYAPPETAQPASTSPPPSSATRRPNRISAG